MVLSHVWFSPHFREKEPNSSVQDPGFGCTGSIAIKKTVILPLQRGRGDLGVLERVLIIAKHIYCRAFRAITPSFSFRGVLITILNKTTAPKDSRVC